MLELRAGRHRDRLTKRAHAQLEAADLIPQLSKGVPRNRPEDEAP